MGIIKGFFVSLSLICAIGAQNAFVIKQGLLKNHIFWVVLICFICDFLLISVGVLGVGKIINDNIYLLLTLTGLGVLFLFFYGLSAFRSAYKGNSSLTLSEGKTSQTSKLAVISMTIAVTLFNPHVYLDTVVIIGGITATLDYSNKLMFMVGAWLASGLWFFSIGYGAKKLSPLFSRPKTWQILDFAIGVLMWAIAFSLCIFIYNEVNSLIN